MDVVGSSIRRVEGESPLPVTTIHRDEIQRSGATRLSELLLRLPYVGASNLGDASAPPSPYSGAASISLRGLGTSATLVLLNGRRVVNFGVAILGGNGNSFVNMNDIPVTAIDRVEVLRDGASAIYGADAVAGAINIVLREDFRGAELQSTYGSTSENDRRKLYIAATIGSGEVARDGFNVTTSAEYLYQERLPLISRGFSRSADHRPNGGLDLRDPQSFPPTVHFPDGGSRAGPGCPPERVRGKPDHSECVFDFAPYEYLTPSIEQANGVVATKWELSGGTRAFTELLLSRARTGNRSRPASVIAELSPDAPTNPYGTALTLDWQPSGVARTSRTTLDRARLVAGIRGYTHGWDWEAVAGYDRSTSKYRGSNELRQSALQQALDVGALNPFIAANDAQALATVTISETDEFNSTLKFAQLKGIAELVQSKRGSLTAALGVERRRESVSNVLDPLLVAGDIGSNGLGAIEETRGARNIDALYGELNWTDLRTLEVQLALRRDEYREFGGATSPKLAVRWQPADGFMARGSVGKGFLAPTLFQTNAPRISFYDIVSDPLRCPVTNQADDCMRSPLHVLLGNPHLRPERSRQANVGMAWEPSPDAFASLDLWRVDLRDKILFGGRFILEHEAEFPGSVVRAAPSSADLALGLPGTMLAFNDVYLNVAQARAQGVDLELRLATGSKSQGRYTLDATATYQHYKVRFAPGSPAVELSGIDGLPRERGIANLLWQRGVWEASVTANYIGPYRYQESITGSLRRMPSWTTFDAQATCGVSENDSLTLRIQNLTAREPPFRTDDPAGYDRFVHDPIGRFLALTWRHTFR